MKRLIIDIETNNLLHKGLDYNQLPYKLKADYKLWCVVVRNIDTDEVFSLANEECTYNNLAKILNGVTLLAGHNLISFDLPVLKLMGVIDYAVAYPDQQSLVNGQACMIYDTLLWSRLLNPDRSGGHSLAAWGIRLGCHKLDFKAFDSFSEEMLTYCIGDTEVNSKLFKHLDKEKGDWAWQRSYDMEAKLADITLNQELVGFQFDVEKANACLVELDTMLTERNERVRPRLPKRRLTKGEQAYYTPPKIQFKKNGDVSAVLVKWCEKVGAELNAEAKTLVFEGQVFNLPFNSPIKTGEEADIDDINNLKGYLLDLGWSPSEWKERDLTKNSDKTSRNISEITKAIERYVAETEESEFREHRCDLIGCSYERLQQTLMAKIDGTKPIRVPTTPMLRVGVEKELCPNLELLGERADFVKDVVEYFTYRHRRNSIAGGGVDEDGEPITGFLSNVREDGRIPTPANTLGANTGRYRHSIVCNIPRVTSLYGEQMRSLFGAGKGWYQLGFDFASLEARIQGHFCIPYTDGVELAKALVSEKPNDIHSINARKLGIDRSSAKSFSYATLYGAQPKKLAKMLGVSESKAKQLFNDYWEAVPALKELKDRLEKYWENKGKSFIIGLDGRKLMTRSKHSLTNVCFQSGGAIAAKWSTVRICQILEEQNLLGNPFRDSDKDLKVWLMICMHDEAQFAVHPKLMKTVAYTEGLEMPELCSAIGHGSKGDYISYATEPVFAIKRGIEEACKEINLRVQLGFEWIAGLNWAQCH